MVVIWSSHPWTGTSAARLACADPLGGSVVHPGAQVWGTPERTRVRVRVKLPPASPMWTDSWAARLGRPVRSLQPSWVQGSDNATAAAGQPTAETALERADGGPRTAGCPTSAQLLGPRTQRAAKARCHTTAWPIPYLCRRLSRPASRPPCVGPPVDGDGEFAVRGTMPSRRRVVLARTPAATRPPRARLSPSTARRRARVCPASCAVRRPEPCPRNLSTAAASGHTMAVGPSKIAAICGDAANQGTPRRGNVLGHPDRPNRQCP